MFAEHADVLYHNLYLEVHPLGETVCISTVRRWLKKGGYLAGVDGDWWIVSAMGLNVMST